MEQRQIIDRRGSGSIKWEVCAPDEIPLWVADMDFASPKVVVDALKARIEHPIFGYGLPDPDITGNFAAWCARRQGWNPRVENIAVCAGVLFAANLAVQFFTQAGDAIVVQTPVYHPFLSIPSGLQRRVVTNPLLRSEAGAGNPYRFDIEGLIAIAKADKAKALLLSSPHNPVGRVWSRDELVALLRACHENGILVISDEIHADIVLSGNRFTSVGDILGREVPASAGIVLQAPSKTFNIAGIPLGLAYIPDPEMLARFRSGLSALGLSSQNVLSMSACSAAYGKGDAWLDEVISILENNVAMLETRVAEWRTRWPAWAEDGSLRLVPLEGSYLAWLSVGKIQKALGLDTKGLHGWLRKNAEVYVSPGSQFGAEGEGFIRLNLGTHGSILNQALEKMESAFDKAYGA